MSVPPEPRPESTRLNRYLAECGLGARRKVEELILSGRISIDGKKSTEPGMKVLPGQEVSLDGQALSRVRKRYFILNKPRGVVCAVSDKYDRTVFDLLDSNLRKLGLFPVGRLDKDSEGLLLLTNDGDLSQKFTHPSGRVIKRYDIHLERSLMPQDLEMWSKGATVEGKWVQPVSVEFLKETKGKDWLRVFLCEGRKRELRIMAETHGFKVIRLVRTAIGRLEIGNVRPGEIREVTREELLALTGIEGEPMKRCEKCEALVVTIDGPAGSGKSTVAKTVASKTGLLYLDTGNLYRAIAFFLSGMGIPPVDNERLKGALLKLDLKLQDGRVSILDQDVTESLHTSEVDRIVSLYAALPSVRESLLSLQRAQAGPFGLVADGRDMGSVVFPWADLKIFLTAAAQERARRRFLEQAARGEQVDFEQVLSVVMSRDKTDSTRSVAPLIIPENSTVIDTTSKTADEVVDEIVFLIEAKRKKLGSMGENHDV